ncbi:hypothetical protein R3P38DRAFT_2839523 [Favolaschia claudopus]|uniref:Zn(2)-C6 fungal-type domain-containing protein n=1 Tax=Favolaschia claudopus TaxID=2862362 RepID=A0AAW0DVZ0_9AGAR
MIPTPFNSHTRRQAPARTSIKPLKSLCTPSTPMPTDPSQEKKRKTVSKPTSEVAPNDHRKKRRNRTTQSCLNCHTTKRMCDRKRPCSRCTQLGLTGLCIYEVDDPNRKPKHPDEKWRMQNRIAELEVVIRELKNKPHPRWTDGVDETILDTQSESSSSSTSSMEPSRHTSTGDLAWTDLINWESSGSSSSSYSHSPVSTPSPLPFPPVSTIHLLPPPNICWEHSKIPQYPVPYKDLRQLQCNCLDNLGCYTVAAELQSHLRRTSAVLSRSFDHCFGSRCLLDTKIRELESLVGDALQNSGPLRSDALAMLAEPPVQLNSMLPSLENSGQQTRIASKAPMWDESGLPAYDESFMAWVSPPPKMYP